MPFYLFGTPISTRKSTYRHDVAGHTVESGHLALVHRAEELHRASPSGLDIAAARLKCSRTVCQLRQARGGSYVILVWIWLSDGARYRVAWACEPPTERLYRSWQRVPWEEVVFSPGSPYKASSKLSAGGGSV